MTRKTRLLNIRTKLLAVSVGIVFLLGMILGGYAISVSKENMIKMGVEQAGIAATMAADSVDGDAIDTLQPGEDESEAYQENVKILRAVKNTCGVKYLYTLYVENNTVFYGIDTDETEDKCAIGDEFEVSYEELHDVFSGSTYVQAYIDYTENGALITAYKPIRNAAGEVVAVLGSDYDAENIVAQMEDMQTKIVSIATIFILISILVLFFIISAITKNINQVNKSLYDLVHNKSDLTQKLSVHTGDEMEVMAENVNALLDYIRVIMVNISQNSQKLDATCHTVVDNLITAGDGITEVSATMQEISAAMQTTSASMNHIHVGIEEVYGRIENISDKASEGDLITKDIQVRAEKIYKQAIQEQENAQNLSKQMENAVKDKIEKSKSVEQINVLTENILSITSQTNLLALNASIEAARAGEAGKGFAVVADEIGKLALDSAKAANQIREVSEKVISAVTELTSEAERMMQFMESTAMEGYGMLSDMSQEYRKDAEDIHDIMTRFSEDADKVENVACDIKDSIKAINSAVEDVANGVMNITNVATSLTSSAVGVRETAEDNSEIAKMLAKEVAKFKLS